MIWRRRRTMPDNVPMPKNVRWCRLDGTEIPLECVYEGEDRDGQHNWVAVLTVRPEDGDSVRMDLLPGKCSVSVVVAP